jgi:hypothetical protein
VRVTGRTHQELPLLSRCFNTRGFDADRCADETLRTAGASDKLVHSPLTDVPLLRCVVNATTPAELYLSYNARVRGRVSTSIYDAWSEPRHDGVLMHHCALQVRVCARARIAECVWCRRRV